MWRLGWITQVFQEASQTNGNMVKQWKRKDSLLRSVLLGTITKCERRRRSVIIVPELTFNLGWINIAENVGRFINSHRNVVNLWETQVDGQKHSLCWYAKESEAEKIIKKGDRICISCSPKECGEVLKRSLVGIFEARIGETPTLSEIRRWLL